LIHSQCEPQSSQAAGGSVRGVIALVLFTIGVLDHPFSGGARIGTGAFELVLNRFETSKLSDLR
jgi:hypothetical protein